MRRARWLFSPLPLALMRPFLSREDYASFRSFIGPALDAYLIDRYREFVSGLLDVTDNLADGRVIHPPEVVRYDGDDPYLVVAADKGTATFSDIANGLAESYGFWLGDAFASGGSAGYDHKKIGITARGAWESVRFHFATLGTDIDADDFTAENITFEKKGALAYVTVNRPKVLNALNRETVDCTALVNTIIDDLRPVTEECGATVLCERLPEGHLPVRLLGWA